MTIDDVIVTPRIELDVPKGKKITRILIQGIENTGLISDGFHTFDELYAHRIALFIALCRYKAMADDVCEHEDGIGYVEAVWRSTEHSDGTKIDGWFIMGINRKAGEQITYHLPLSQWEETNFAETLPRAPLFDGHSSDDVVERLKNLC